MSDKHISISDSTGVHTFNASVAPAISFTGAFSGDPDDFDFDEWIRHNPKAVDVILDKICKAVRSGNAALAACFCQSLSFMCGTVVFQPWQ